MTLTLADLTVPPPPESPLDWNEDGVLHLPGFYAATPGLIDAYVDRWRSEFGQSWPADVPLGWAAPPHPNVIPFTTVPEILDLLAPLAPVIEALLGEPGGASLNLTGWVSTERAWHQDSYLNDPYVDDRYAAVWIALDDIHPDSGPFQYVRGSHRWPQVTRAAILDALGEPLHAPSPHWPWASEAILEPLFEQEIAARGAEVYTHLPRRGDVLVWHGRLLHRGSRPNVPGMERRSFIAHFSGVNHRPDMPAAVQHPAGGWYFPL
jgi:hypothetical protein